MTKRRSISGKERLAIFNRDGGICHMCRTVIQVGQPWEVSHDIPLELGGADHGDNLKPAHKACHAVTTAKADAPDIAKAKRREVAHKGAQAPTARPLHGAAFPIGKGRKTHPIAALPPRRLFQDA